MQIRFADARPTGEFALVLPSSGTYSSGLDSLGAAKAGVAAALKRSRFEGDVGSVVEIFLEGDGGRRLIVVGTGSKATDGDAAEKLAGAAIARLLTSGETHAVIDLTELKLDADAAARVALAAGLRSWRYDRYRTRLKEKQKLTLTTVTIVGAGQAAEERYATRYAAVVEGVAQGSVREPKLLVMKWNGGKDGEAPVAFIGKGVTFDTGGISIKPAQNMEAMKWDMGGAGAVVGAMKALAGRKAKANVVAVCGLVENMPDGNAQRPGDVVTTMSGQTVEVINTDAEGRLVLCDAMTWTQRTFKPKSMIDLATLTGAIVITLGHEYAGLFSNDEALSAQLIKSAGESGDKLWRQPLAESYDRLIDSPIADMKNVGPREAGSITAAQFLNRYVDDGVAWAHLDIAGMAWADKASATAEKGATGFGVRLLDQFIADSIEA